jgi:hypothetical protein
MQQAGQIVQMIQLPQVMQVVLVGACLHLCDTEATIQACVQFLDSNDKERHGTSRNAHHQLMQQVVQML